MKRMLKQIFFAALVMAGIMLFSSGVSMATPSSQALFSESNLGGGQWRYDYTLINTSDPVADAGFDVFDFFLKIDPAGTLSNILSPASWDQNSDSSSFIQWFSTAPGEPPAGADIAPGTSLNGFNFDSNTRLASLSFEVTLNNPLEPGNPLVLEGNSAPASSPVPEPAILLLLVNGLAGIAYLEVRKIFKS
jgi:hypothetical protein